MPVATAVTSGRVHPLLVPEGTFAVATHTGPFSNLDCCLGQVGTFVAEHSNSGHAPFREYYVDTPAGVEDQSEFETEVCWPVLGRHVIAGDAMAIALVGGATSETALKVLTGSELKEDCVAQFTSTANTMLEVFQQPGSMERVVHHPMGDVPASQVLGFRVGEAALHGWDLAQAIGVDDTLNHGVVQAVWDAMEPSKDMLASLGIFGDGPSGTVGPDEPQQLRLLDLSGRRP